MGKSEAKATTEMKTEVKATTAAKTEMKSEAKATTEAKSESLAKMENEAFAEARSEMKSLIASKAESDAENFSEFETQTRLTNKWIMIKGRGNLCIKFTGGRKRIRYGGRYIIMNRSGYVVDLYAYKRNNGAHIYAWNRKNGTNQRWSLSNIGGGRYLIRSQHSRKCLDNTGTARVNRHYHQWSCNKRNANQHFYLRPIKRKAVKNARGAKKNAK